MWTDEELAVAAKAMQNSKAWPVVFQAGAAMTLARAASEAVERYRAERADRSEARELGCRLIMLRRECH